MTELLMTIVLWLTVVLLLVAAVEAVVLWRLDRAEARYYRRRSS